MKNNRLTTITPKAGDVVKVKRPLGYYHFGVYVGRQKVIHFSTLEGSELDADAADIIETSLSTFCNGDQLEIDTREKPAFTSQTIVNRARRSLGTQKGQYSLLFNNCEHFANYCKTGRRICNQEVDVLIKLIGVIFLR